MPEDSLKPTTRAQRLHDTERAVARQVHIAASHNASPAQPGRLRKHHAMESASPALGNPRHRSNVSALAALTVQEKQFLDIQEEGVQELAKGADS